MKPITIFTESWPLAYGANKRPSIFSKEYLISTAACDFSSESESSLR